MVFDDLKVKVKPMANKSPRAVDSVTKKSSKHLLRKYTEPEGYSLRDGVAYAGEHIEIDFYCMVQPYVSRDAKGGVRLHEEGERTEKSIVVHYNPYHPKNLKINPAGVFVRTSDDRREITGDYNGFSDLFFFADQWWKPTTNDIFQPSNNETIGRVGMELYRGGKSVVTPEINEVVTEDEDEERNTFELGSTKPQYFCKDCSIVEVDEQLTCCRKCKDSNVQKGVIS